LIGEIFIKNLLCGIPQSSPTLAIGEQSNAVESLAQKYRDRRCLILLDRVFPAKERWGYLWGYPALIGVHTPRRHTPL
jgi:hypothetical protein